MSPPSGNPVPSCRDFCSQGLVLRFPTDREHSGSSFGLPCPLSLDMLSGRQGHPCIAYRCTSLACSTAEDVVLVFRTYLVKKLEMGECQTVGWNLRHRTDDPVRLRHPYLLQLPKGRDVHPERIRLGIVVSDKRAVLVCVIEDDLHISPCVYASYSSVNEVGPHIPGRNLVVMFPVGQCFYREGIAVDVGLADG